MEQATLADVQSRPSSAGIATCAEESNPAALLERILRNPRIPTPPTLALQVFQKAGQEDCPIQEITDLLGHDPGFCAKILRALCSACYGLSRPVTSVRQAVTMLGYGPLRSLVLGLSLPVMQSGVTPDAGLRWFWRQSVAGAVLARELAIRRKFPAPDDELAAGLLRDLGMILLRQTFEDEYQPLWTRQDEDASREPCDWEQRILGIDHAEVGAQLLDRWKLPPEIVEPVRFHHRPERLPVDRQAHARRTRLLNFVSRLAELDEIGSDGPRLEALLQRAQDDFGLSRADLEQFLAEVRPKVDEWSSVLGVDIGGCPDFEELLVTGCDELVRLSLETATTLGLHGQARQSAAIDQTVVSGQRSPFVIDGTDPAAPPAQFLQYEGLELIGRGGMGIVYRAFDPALDRHVAIKRLSPEFSGSRNARARFAQEARFAAAIRHEHVVTIFAVTELDGDPVLVMEFVPGASLEEHLEDRRSLSIPQIAEIGRQTALGLAAAHDLRMVHRDVKPANILLEEGTLKVRITDFGVARALDEDSQLSQNGMLIGTPAFMSPEQVDGKPLTPASDLFSLGSVLYAACTGTLPFRAESMTGLLHAVARKPATPIRLLNREVPEGLARVIESLHAKDPSQRPATGQAVAAALAPWCASHVK